MITSFDNERVKFVRALQSRRRARRKSSRFVAEGANLAREIIASQTSVETVFYTESFAANNIDLLDGLSSLTDAMLPVSDPVMASMSGTKTPQGIVAVLPFLNLDPPSNIPFVLIIDRVADPGNMGAVMRAAAGAGVPLMMVTAGTVDLTNPKVIRSAVGAHFRLPVQYLSWEGIAGRLSEHVIFLADPSGGAPYYQVDWTQPCALIISDEAHGPGNEARRLAHAQVTIPMPGGIESLNLATAASILIFEWARQISLLDN